MLGNPHVATQTFIKLLTCLPLSGLLRITSFCRKVSVSRSVRGRSSITTPIHSPLPTKLCCLCWAGWLQHFTCLNWMSQQGWRCISSLVSAHRNCGISCLVLPDYGLQQKKSLVAGGSHFAGWYHFHGLRATKHTLESCGDKKLLKTGLVTILLLCRISPGHANKSSVDKEHCTLKLLEFCFLPHSCQPSWGYPVSGQELGFDHPSGSLPAEDIPWFHDSWFILS